MVATLVVIGYVVFVLVLMAGVLATLLGLPGTFLIVADALVMSACTHWQRPSLWTLLVVLLLAVVAETCDNLLSILATRHGGASGKTGMVAMVGGVAGALLGAGISPVFGAIGVLGGVVGFLLGVVIVPLALALGGGYLAAYWYELRQGRTPEEAARAGKGALFGRLLGGLAKTLLAIVMVAIILFAAFHTRV
jgi:hypothetical protein